MIETYPARSVWGLKLGPSWLTPDGMLTLRPQHARRFSSYSHAERVREWGYGDAYTIHPLVQQDGQWTSPEPEQ